MIIIVMIMIIIMTIILSITQRERMADAFNHEENESSLHNVIISLCFYISDLRIQLLLQDMLCIKKYIKKTGSRQEMKLCGREATLRS